MDTAPSCIKARLLSVPSVQHKKDEEEKIINVILICKTSECFLACVSLQTALLFWAKRMCSVLYIMFRGYSYNLIAVI